jgi:cysteine synthase
MPTRFLTPFSRPRHLFETECITIASSSREAQMARFQNILETVGNTPVVRINRLAPPGVNLFVKIEAFNPLGSV